MALPYCRFCVKALENLRAAENISAAQGYLFQILVEECKNFLAVFESHEILVAVVALGVGAEMYSVSTANFGDAFGKQSAVLIGNDCVGKTLLNHGGRNVLVNHVVGAYGAQQILVLGAESKL